MEIKTINFQPIIGEVDLTDARKVYDIRNGIVCYNPTMDLTCYYNYISYLNTQQDQWRNFGYLDMGMVPLAMLPSFFPEEIKEVLSNAARVKGITVHSMPPVSNLRGSYRGTVNDVWIFREELAEALGVRYQEIMKYSSK